MITSVQAALLVHLFLFSIVSSLWSTSMLVLRLVMTVHQAHVFVSVPILLLIHLTYSYTLNVARLNFTLWLQLSSSVKRRERDKSRKESTQRLKRTHDEQGQPAIYRALHDDDVRRRQLSPFARFRLLIADALGLAMLLSRPIVANHDSFGPTLHLYTYVMKRLSHVIENQEMINSQRIHEIFFFNVTCNLGDFSFYIC